MRLCEMHFRRIAKGRRRRRRRQDGGKNILLDAEVGGQVLPPLLLLLLLHRAGQLWHGGQLQSQECCQVFSQPTKNNDRSSMKIFDCVGGS